MNWSMGAPEPTVGEVIWMVCPYRDDLCGADATLIVEEVSDLAVTGLLVCAAGHRWHVSKLAGSEQP